MAMDFCDPDGVTFDVAIQAALVDEYELDLGLKISEEVDDYE